ITGAAIGDRHDHRARRKIDAGGDRSSREDRVEQSRAHHFFDDQFPGRQMSRMMRSDAAAQNSVPMTMTANLRMLLDEAAHELAPLFASFISRTAPAK